MEANTPAAGLLLISSIDRTRDVAKRDKASWPNWLKSAYATLGEWIVGSKFDAANELGQYCAQRINGKANKLIAVSGHGGNEHLSLSNTKLGELGIEKGCVVVSGEPLTNVDHTDLQAIFKAAPVDGALRMGFAGLGSRTSFFNSTTPACWVYVPPRPRVVQSVVPLPN